MTPRTVQRWSTRSNETAVSLSRPSALIRLHAYREDAARLMRRVTPRGTKLTGISSQKLSIARDNGGAIGDVACLMVAKPAIAQTLAAYIQGVADSLTLGADCVVMAARDAQHDDSAQDNARTELLAAIAEDRLTPDELETLVAACDAQIASTRILRRAAAAKAAAAKIAKERP